MTNSLPWKGPPFLIGKPSINGPSIPWRTVSHNQRLNISESMATWPMVLDGSWLQAICPSWTILSPTSWSTTTQRRDSIGIPLGFGEDWGFEIAGWWLLMMVIWWLYDGYMMVINVVCIYIYTLVVGPTHSSYPLIMTNSSPWYRWPIEKDGLANLIAWWIFPWRTVTNNQMVLTKLLYSWPYNLH